MPESRAKQLFESMEKLKKLMMRQNVINGIPNREFMVLKIISHSGQCDEDCLMQCHPNGVKVSVISKHLGVTASAASQTINILEDKGLIKREMTKTDRRSVYAVLTEEGERVLKGADDAFLNYMDQLFEKLGQEDSDTFIRILDKMYNVVKELKPNLL